MNLYNKAKAANVIFILLAYFFIYSLLSPLSAHENSTAEIITSNRSLKQLMEKIANLEQKNLLDGKVVFAKGNQILFVAQNREFAEMEEEPQYMIASVSKQFFASALLKLLYESSPPSMNEKTKCENVKRLLAEPLSHFLPPTANIWNGNMPKWAERITLHHLLSQTSGLANYTETKEYYQVSKTGKRFFEIPHSKKNLVNLIAKKPLLFRPGAQFSYSNTNYVLIAEIIEVLAQEPASTYLEQRIFKPLGLNSTFCPLQGGCDVLKKSPQLSHLAPQWFYDVNDKKSRLYPLQANENVSNAVGSGSIISTATDLLKWNLALHKEQSIIAKSLHQMMVTPNLENYGYGIGLAKSKLGTVYRHLGQIDAYRSRLYYFPEEALSIIVLTSTSPEDDDIDERDDKSRGFNLIVNLIDSKLKIES